MTVIAPASANLHAAARPMPDEPPVTSTTLPPTVPLQRVVDVQRRVEVALPVVPQAPGVVVELRALDARALQRGQRLAAVEARREVDEGQHVLGQAEVLHAPRLRTRRTGASAIRPFLTLLRDEAEQRRVDEQVHLRRMRRLAEDVEHVADAVAQRVDQMEALLVEVGLRWLMWSSAATTKSTGTMLMRPPSRPTDGIHGGSSWRMRWISLKK